MMLHDVSCEMMTLNYLLVKISTKSVMHAYLGNMYDPLRIFNPICFGINCESGLSRKFWLDPKWIGLNGPLIRLGLNNSSWSLNIAFRVCTLLWFKFSQGNGTNIVEV